jgi:hypothetical protein
LCCFRPSILKQIAKNMFMAVFILLWSCLITTKLSCLQKKTLVTLAIAYNKHTYKLLDPMHFFFFAGVIIYVFESFHFNADWYNYLFPVFLYPFAEIAQCSSIYMTVAIAVERFIGLCRPFRRLSSRPCPAKAYILPGN